MHSMTKDILEKLIKKGILRDTNILVVCAWISEKTIFEELGFQNVTFTNIDDNRQNMFEPYPFEWQDAMNLTYEDDSFDYVLVCCALHHCSSPHRALLEMYRVAKKSIIMFESADTFLMRIAVRLGLTAEYEEIDLFASQGCGGYNNSAIPNYIYRWTKREFEKTICSYYPIGKNKFMYYRTAELPQRILKNKILALLCNIILFLFPSGKNVFCAIATKPETQDDIFSWIKNYSIDYKEIMKKNGVSL